jgi:hypothetical protein
MATQNIPSLGTLRNSARDWTFYVKVKIGGRFKKMMGLGAIYLKRLLVFVQLFGNFTAIELYKHGQSSVHFSFARNFLVISMFS